MVIAAAAILISSLVHRELTQEAITASAIAATVCWVAAALALMATQVGNWLRAPVPGLLLSMFFRMGLPLAALVAFPKMGEPLSGTGVPLTILGVYFVALALETV